MKKIFLIITLFLFIVNPVFAKNSYVTKDYKVQSVDGFNIQATLQYPKVKGKKDYSTVVLVHSLGYSSEWWDSFPKELLESGYAVLMFDLRGHGKSVDNSQLVKSSWKSMTNSAFAKYPEDFVKVLESVKSDNIRRTFFNNWAIIGADIGASTAVIGVDDIDFKPKTIVFLSPVIETKGLYVPVKLANVNCDILSISGNGDFMSQEAEKYLKKFAQASFATYTSEVKTTGMMLLRKDNTMPRIITSWLAQYL